MYYVLDDQTLGIKRPPGDGNIIDFSMLTKLETKPSPFKGFSIKYVLEGCERYRVNGHQYPIHDGEYLLGNAHCEGSLIIDSETIVKGICIDISPEIITEVTSRILRPGLLEHEPGLGQFFTSSEFPENKYRSGENSTGNLLFQLGEALRVSPYEAHQFDKEFYFSLAESIISDHIPVYSQLRAIQSVKPETRKDLFKRTYKAKQLLDEQFHLDLSMDKIAQYAGLSEYLFFRLFKTIYKETPSRYRLKKRLAYAHELLNKGDTVSNIIFLCGFNDIHVFSKTFRKFYGYPPSALYGK